MQSKTIAVYSDKVNKTIWYDPVVDRFVVEDGYRDDLLKGRQWWWVDCEVSEDDAVWKKMVAFNRGMEVRTDKIKWLKFFATAQCNISCEYCIVKGFGQWEKVSGKKGLLPKAEWVKAFLDKHRSVQWLLFTGGEPLVVWEEIREVIKDFKDKMVRINTNGLLITESIVREALSRGGVQFHISVDVLDKNNDQRKDYDGKDTQWEVREKLRGLVKAIP